MQSECIKCGDMLTKEKIAVSEICLVNALIFENIYMFIYLNVYQNISRYLELSFMSFAIFPQMY